MGVDNEQAFYELGGDVFNTVYISQSYSCGP